MEETAALVVMAKQPRVGYTKTRLCPPFSAAQAAAFAEVLLLDSLALAGRLAGVRLAVAFTPASARRYFKQISPPGTYLVAVEGPDIGQCLVRAFDALFLTGFRKVIALNGDGPSLPLNYLLQALHSLDENDVVIGPGEDGGYYLIGLKSPCPSLFDQIEWSTEKVLQQTLDRLFDQGLQAYLTPPWYDVDTIREVKRIAAELDQLPEDQLIHTRHFFKNMPHGDWNFK